MWTIGSHWNRKHAPFWTIFDNEVNVANVRKMLIKALWWRADIFWMISECNPALSVFIWATRHYRKTMVYVRIYTSLLASCAYPFGHISMRYVVPRINFHGSAINICIAYIHVLFPGIKWLIPSRALPWRIYVSLVLKGLITSSVKSCVRYISANLFCMSKKDHLWNKGKWFLFHFKNSFCSWDNHIWTFQVFKCYDVNMKHEAHITK